MSVLGQLKAQPISLLSQGVDTTQYVRVILYGGTELQGRVLAADAQWLTLQTIDGATLRVAREQVREILRLEGMVREGRWYPPDPNRIRLFVAPTAFPSPQGSGYFSVFEVFFSFFCSESIRSSDHWRWIFFNSWG